MSFPSFDGMANFAASLVASAPSPATSGTTLDVTAGQGGNFPTPPFDAVVWPAGSQPTAANAEICRVTTISTDTLTIVRGPNPSSLGDTGGINRTVVVGDNIAANITLKALADVQAAVNVGAYNANAVTTNTSTGGTPVVAMSFNVAANRVYQFSAAFQAQAGATTTGATVRIVGPTGATLTYNMVIATTNPGVPSAIAAGRLAAVTTSGTWVVVNTSTNLCVVIIKGTAQIQTTAGTLSLQMVGGSTTGASNVTIAAGGSFTAFRVA